MGTMGLETGRKKSKLTVRPVTTWREFRHFMGFPYTLYRGDPVWVSPLRFDEKRSLRPKTNQFLRENPYALFVSYDGNETVGRVAVFINISHNQIHAEKTAFFGFFECVESPEVSQTLFDAAIKWSLEKGADRIRGPINFSLNNVAGLQTSGFNESAFILMGQNRSYYLSLLENQGFKPVMNFFAYDITRDTIRFPRFLERIEEKLAGDGFLLRSLDPKQLQRDIGIITRLFNSAWSKNWGFTPIGIEEGLEDIEKVKMFVKYDLILIAEHHGKPVGFSLSLPDINQALKPLNGRLWPHNLFRLMRGIRRIDQIRVLLMGILDDYRGNGIDLLLYKKTFENSRRYGYHRAELSWILENNRMMNRVLEHINARKYKTYAIFEKPIR